MKARQIIVEKNAERLAQKGAALFYEQARDAVTEKGHFAVAISGGGTPREMHRLFSKAPLRQQIAWEKTHLFWVDERAVPYDHPASNYGAAKADFIEKLTLSGDRIYPMPVGVDPETNAAEYQRQLQSFFKGKNAEVPVFDLIVLGVGTDGHTASLFPTTPADISTDKWVMAVKGGDPDVLRLTLTLPVINRARQVLFLVSGARKARIVKKVLENEDPLLPAARIRPESGHLMWLLDTDAASLLARE